MRYVKRKAGLFKCLCILYCHHDKYIQHPPSTLALFPLSNIHTAVHRSLYVLYLVTQMFARRQFCRTQQLIATKLREKNVKKYSFLEAKGTRPKDSVVTCLILYFLPAFTGIAICQPAQSARR